MTQFALPLDGHCSGPLFAPPAKRRPPKPHNGPERVRVVRSRQPAWAKPSVMRAMKALASATSRCLDHVVPINHPLVCGLHVEWNLQVITSAENLAKSNNWWPDMWGKQEELFQ
jgi:hypothetical protein